MLYTKTQGFILKGTLGVMTLSSLMFTTTLADDYLYVNATHLNVRSANTFRSSIVATVDNGYKVTVLESQENGWKKVLLENGSEGYVNGRYLTEQEPYFEKAQGAVYAVNVYSAYMRGEDLIKKTAVLHKGDRLEVLDEKVFLGQWLRVKILSSVHGRYNDRVGYVSKKLVSVDESSIFTQQSQDVSMDATQTESTVTTEDTGAILEDIGLNSAPAETIASTDSGTTTESGSTDDADLGNLLGGLLK